MRFHAGVVSQRETGRAPEWALPGNAPGPGEIGCMHASPPCQGITPVNTKRNAESLSAPGGLFPLLAEVRSVDKLPELEFIFIPAPLSQSWFKQALPVTVCQDLLADCL